jgi:hypothetical protein
MRSLFLLPLLALASCGETTGGGGSRRPPTFTPPPTKQLTGLDRVMGQNASALVSLFGPAVQDVREDTSRKLQFSGFSCILDAYLYPPSKGREPLVTYLTARVPDGREADKASCVASLTRR